MTDIVIRDLPDDVIVGLDRKAKERGLSLEEFIRLRLVESVSRSRERVTVESLRYMSERFAELADSEVTAAAWR